MRTKKDLVKRPRGLFLLGLTIALSLTLMAFEWASFSMNYKIEEPIIKQEFIEIITPEKIVLEKPKPKTSSAPKAEQEIDYKKIDSIKLIKDKDSVFYVKSVSKNNGPISDSIIEIEDEDDTAQIIEFPDKSAEFPGGLEALYKYLSENIKYPYIASQIGVQGKVLLRFVVEKNGSISQIEIARGIGSGCDDEAVRVVEGMPNWKPGRKKGLPVRTRFVLPIIFKLKSF